MSSSTPLLTGGRHAPRTNPTIGGNPQEATRNPQQTWRTGCWPTGAAVILPCWHSLPTAWPELSAAGGTGTLSPAGVKFACCGRLQWPLTRHSPRQDWTGRSGLSTALRQWTGRQSPAADCNRPTMDDKLRQAAPDCPRHPKAEVHKIEHVGELTPAFTLHCNVCDRELVSSGDGTRIDW